MPPFISSDALNDESPTSHQLGLTRAADDRGDRTNDFVGHPRHQKETPQVSEEKLGGWGSQFTRHDHGT